MTRGIMVIGLCVMLILIVSLGLVLSINTMNNKEYVGNGVTRDVLSMYESGNVVDVLYSSYVSKFLDGEIGLGEFAGGGSGKWVYVEIKSLVLIDPESYEEQIKPPDGCELFRLPRPPAVFKARVLDSILNAEELEGKDIFIIGPRMVYDAEKGKVVYDDEIRPLIPGKRYVLKLEGNFTELKRRVCFVCKEDGKAYDIRSTITLLKQDAYSVNEILVFVEIDGMLHYLYSDRVLKDPDYSRVLHDTNTLFKYKGDDPLLTSSMPYSEFKEKLLEELRSKK